MLRRVDYDEAIDCWSLGVLLYNFVTGRMPFAAKYQHKIAELTMRKEPQFKDKVWKQCSPDAKDLVLRLLTKDPTKRLDVEAILAHPWLRDADEEKIILNEKQRKKLYLKRTVLK